MTCKHELTFHTGVCRLCGWIADTSPSMDLYDLREEQDLLYEMVMVSSPSQKMYREMLDEVTEKIRKITDLYGNHFPKRVIFPSFELKSHDSLRCPQCGCDRLTKLPVADAVQCDDCDFAFSEGLGK